MDVPLIVDEQDPKWELLGQILKIFASRRVKQELARQGLTPIPKAALMLRVTLVAMFFSLDLAYVVDELQHRKALRNFAKVPEAPTRQQVSSFLGRFTPPQFMTLVLGVLNQICSPRPRGRSTFLVDSTEIRVDINWFRKTWPKPALADRDFQWGYSASKGYYLGYKLSLVVMYPSLQPVSFLLHPGSPADVELWEKILQEGKRRRIIRNGDLVLADKGYFKYLHYQAGVTQYKIVPGIFPRKNTPPEKILDQLIYPLTSYRQGRSARDRALYPRLKAALRHVLEHWKEYRPIRSRIEDFFKAGKEAFGWGVVHRYTQRSVAKHLAVGVLLMGLVVHFGFREKKALQQLAEW
jgi:hypothetical protein